MFKMFKMKTFKKTINAQYQRIKSVFFSLMTILLLFPSLHEFSDFFLPMQYSANEYFGVATL